MKTEFIDVTATEKHLVVEIPSGVVDAEIDRVARDYSRAARIPGFRPGKVPARVVRQRFRSQILHDVAHGLIPRAVDEALRERGVEPVDTPDIRDVVVEEGQPLKFTATFETVPPLDPGDYAAVTLRRPAATVEDQAVDEALARLRERAARYEPVEDRPAERWDTVVVDLQRQTLAPSPGGGGNPPLKEAPAAEKLEGVSVELGASANPPGFDDHLAGTEPGATRQFTVSYPADYAIGELAGSEVEYNVTVRGIKKRVLPELDDEFAKDLGDFASLDVLRQRVREDLMHDAEHAVDRQIRAELLKQLAARVSFDVPQSLVAREVDRRVEEFVRRLIDQRIDPMRTNIDWEEFKEHQREPALEAVRGALVLDEVARREGLAVTEDEIGQEVERYAGRTGRPVAAVRAQLEKEGGLGRLHAGLRREKAIDFLLSRATIVAG
jgi:trigger factor